MFANTMRTSLIYSGLLAGVATASSLAFACAAPFAALAFVAVLFQPIREAALTLTLAWAVNQIVGFGLLGYPQDLNTIFWGGALFLAALLPLVALHRMRPHFSHQAWLIAGFPVAFLVNQASLYFISRLFTSQDSGFALSVIGQVLWSNMVGLAVLFAVAFVAHRLAAGVSPKSADAARAG